VFNLRICGIIALLAFLLSFLIGLISRSTLPILLVRPLIFAGVFFGISAVINIVVSRFLPELLEDNLPDNDSEFMPGSRVNIMEGDSGEAPPLDYSHGVSPAVPEHVHMGAQPDDSTDEVGDISSLASLVTPVRGPSFGSNSAPAWVNEEGSPGGMDHNAKNGYNGREGVADFSNEVKTVHGATEPRRMEVMFDSDEMLPDLDSMAGAFVSSYSNEETDTTEYSVSTPARKSASPAKGSEWAGDFNAKDIAAGLRTVLNRDKEG
jgi:hypothetical protein